MANSASLQLFELIHSMTRSEKRYFKIYIRTHSSKHEEDYIHLFNMVSGQENYDELALVAGFEKRDNTQRFAILKHRLYEKLLDSLESFERGKDESMDLRHSLNKAQVLIKRGLNRGAEQLIKKVQARAIAIHEAPLALEAKVMLAQYFEIDQSKEELGSALSHVQDRLRLLEIRQQLFAELRSEGRSSGKRAEAQAKLMTEINTILGKEAQDPLVQYLGHHAHSVSAFAQDDTAASLLELEACLKLLSQYPTLNELMPTAQVDMAANAMYCNTRLHKPEAARSALQVLLSISEESMRTHLRRDHRGTVTQSLLQYLDKYDDPELELRLSALIEGFEAERWDHSPVLRAGIDYGLGLYHHARGERGLALRCLNRVLNDGEVRRDEDIYHRTLVLVTLLHAESGDRSWMVHSARALKRYLRPRGLEGAAESLLLDYIAGLRRSRSPEGEHKALARYIDSLRAIRKLPEERLAFEFFDFLAWAEALKSALDHESLVA